MHTTLIYAKINQTIKIADFTFHHFPCNITKKVLKYCALKFDATDLPHSSIEPLYIKVFKGTPKVALRSMGWRPGPSKVT